MSKRSLPRFDTAMPYERFETHPPIKALEHWNGAIRAASEDGDNVITMFGVIGSDFLFEEGVTAKRVQAALKRIGAQDVVVHINSPGGDYFEGLAIYNLLRDHPHQVTVKVFGMAASAASLIAMAGDDIRVGRAAFFMIHNVWAIGIGDRHAFRDAADWLEPFDRAAADVYSARTEIDRDEIAAMMDRETWISGSDAIDQGFADGLLPSDEVAEDGEAGEGAPEASARLFDVCMARAGLARSERRRMIRDFKSGTPGAAGSGMPSAAEHVTPRADVLEKGLNRLNQTILEI